MPFLEMLLQHHLKHFLSAIIANHRPFPAFYQMNFSVLIGNKPTASIVQTFIPRKLAIFLQVLKQRVKISFSLASLAISGFSHQKIKRTPHFRITCLFFYKAFILFHYLIALMANNSLIALIILK